MVFSAILNRNFRISVSATTVVFSTAFASRAQAQIQTLNGAGATFPKPLYQKYASEIRKNHPRMKINYQGIGSSGGIRNIIAGTVDFGGSDAAITDAEIAKVNRGVMLIPTAGGAVCVVYNLPGVSNLKLSRKSFHLVIFSGQITKWNDLQIRADNPGVTLPGSSIRTVVRADGSGTSFIFTNHLSNISPYFKGRIGTRKKPKCLPQSLKGKGNPGVAALVKRASGSVGYAEYGYAKRNNLKCAQVQNSSGQFVAPSLETGNAS